MPNTIEELKTKVCSLCNIDKDYSLYHKKTKNGRVTVQAKCKECTSIYKKKRYYENREHELAIMTKSRLKPDNVQQRKGYYKKNKEKYLERHKKYMSDEDKRQRKLELSRILYKKTREKVQARHKINYLKPENIEKRKQKHNERKKTDLNYVIKRRLRFRLRHIIDYLEDKKYKHKSAVELIGCDLEFFKRHIEQQFKDGMSWERLDEIHIDHIKPCVKFDLTKLEEQQKCFHYTNLQPLWSVDNLKKGSFYNELIKKN